MTDENLIEKIIQNNLDKNKEYTFKFRLKNQKVWENFLENLNDSLINYSNQELNYQLLYRKEENFDDQDYSFICLKKQEPVCIVALTICKSKSGEVNEISSYGEPLLAPLILDNMNLEEKKELIKILYNIIKEISFNLKVKKIISCENFLKEKNTSEWCFFLRNLDLKIDTVREGYIDLTKRIEKIETNLKKKKILYDINKAKKLWDAKIKHQLKLEEWLEFKNLHLKVSGKKTRSDKTWDSQYRDIVNGNAFVVFVYKDKKIVGGGMYRYSKTMALYAVGVYDRSLFPKPISHLVHYLAIHELKKKNIRWLKMGDIPSLEDYNNPTSKNVSIGLFKRKFSTHIFDKKIYYHMLN